MMQRVEKPWGHEIIWAKTGAYVGKKLFIRKGHKLSLQYHRLKDETIYVHSGEMQFTVEENGELTVRKMSPGESYHIRPGIRHRMEALTDCEVFDRHPAELAGVPQPAETRP